MGIYIVSSHCLILEHPTCFSSRHAEKLPPSNIFCYSGQTIFHKPRACFFFEDLFSKGGKDDFPGYDMGLFDLEDGTASPLSAFLDILKFSSHPQLAQEQHLFFGRWCDVKYLLPKCGHGSKLENYLSHFGGKTGLLISSHRPWNNGSFVH